MPRTCEQDLAPAVPCLGVALTHFARDFVFCLASIRMRSYGILPALDRLNALRIVGNSIPAVATSTAIAAGLACMELYARPPLITTLIFRIKCALLLQVQDRPQSRRHLQRLCGSSRPQAAPCPVLSILSESRLYSIQ